MLQAITKFTNNLRGESVGHRMIIPNSIKLQVITDYILGLLAKIMKNISEKQ